MNTSEAFIAWLVEHGAPDDVFQPILIGLIGPSFSPIGGSWIQNLLDGSMGKP